jgi:hypothetical protein
MNYLSSAVHRATALSALLLGFSGTGAAQQRASADEQERARRVQVTIAIVDSSDDAGAPAKIVRLAHGPRRDIVLIRRGAATGAQLASALQVLLVTRELHGDTAQQDMGVRVPGPLASKPRSSELYRLADAAMVELLRRPAAPLSGVGDVQWMDIYLLPNALTGAVRRSRQ